MRFLAIITQQGRRLTTPTSKNQKQNTAHTAPSGEGAQKAAKENKQTEKRVVASRASEPAPKDRPVQHLLIFEGLRSTEWSRSTGLVGRLIPDPPVWCQWASSRPLASVLEAQPPCSNLAAETAPTQTDTVRISSCLSRSVAVRDQFWRSLC